VPSTTSQPEAMLASLTSRMTRIDTLSSPFSARSSSTTTGYAMLIATWKIKHLTIKRPDANLSQVMRYIFYLVIAVILAGCGSDGEIHGIAVKMNLKIPLGAFRQAYIDSQNDGFSDIKQRRDDHWAFHVFSEVRAAMRPYGLHSYPTEKDADVRVECIVKAGRGLPRFRRQFKLITEYIDFVNIKFIDTKTRKVIGEVEYHRPSLADNPPYLVRTMIDKLVQSAAKPKGG
jgi:hypothetical protein